MQTWLPLPFPPSGPEYADYIPAINKLQLNIIFSKTFAENRQINNFMIKELVC